MYSEAKNPIAQKRNLITAIPGPKSEQLIKRRAEAVSASLGTAFPVFIERAEGSIILDVDGNSILDLGAGIAVLNVGHSSPKVIENVKTQMDAFTHTCFMVVPYTGYVEVCEALNRLTPGTHKKKSALFNSGAEAVENAVKIARKFTKRSAVVVFEHGYHGRTNLTMAMTAKNMPYKDGFGPFAPEVYRMPMAYPYRCDACVKPCESSVLSMVLHKIEKEIGASNVACIVIEPILGEGGFIVPCKGFLPGLAKFCKDNGIIFIADEVQTGFGRTGHMFASEDESVVPDLIVTAKGIAAGLPLAGQRVLHHLALVGLAAMGCDGGHEGVGRVERLGPGVTTDYAGVPVKTGDLVYWAPIALCHRCHSCTVLEETPCENSQFFEHADKPNWGSYADYAVLPTGLAFFRVPDGTSTDAVIALGGGVIGDLAGFAAACWMARILGLSRVKACSAMFCWFRKPVTCASGKTMISTPGAQWAMASRVRRRL